MYVLSCVWKSVLVILGDVHLKRLSSWVTLAVVISWYCENIRFLMKVTPRSLMHSFVGMGINPSGVLKPYVNVDSLPKLCTHFEWLSGIPSVHTSCWSHRRSFAVHWATYSRFSNHLRRGATNWLCFLADHVLRSWKGIGLGHSPAEHRSVLLMS